MQPALLLFVAAVLQFSQCSIPMGPEADFDFSSEDEAGPKPPSPMKTQQEEVDLSSEDEAKQKPPQASPPMGIEVDHSQAPPSPPMDTQVDDSSEDEAEVATSPEDKIMKSFDGESRAASRQLRSTYNRYSRRSKLTFTNRHTGGRRIVYVWWINYAGQKRRFRHFATLRSGHSYTVNTYTTHPWIVTGYVWSGRRYVYRLLALNYHYAVVFPKLYHSRVIITSHVPRYIEKSCPWGVHNVEHLDNCNFN